MNARHIAAVARGSILECDHAAGMDWKQVSISRQCWLTADMAEVIDHRTAMAGDIHGREARNAYAEIIGLDQIKQTGEVPGGLKLKAAFTAPGHGPRNTHTCLPDA